MSPNSNLLEFKITDMIKELASDGLETLKNDANRAKVYHEEICRIIFTSFLAKQEKLSVAVSANLPDNQSGVNRRELFPLNLIRVNDLFLTLITVGTGTSDKIFIPRKIFNTKLASDYYLPLILDLRENKILVPGFASYENVLKQARVHSDDYYFISKEKLLPISDLFTVLANGVQSVDQSGLEDPSPFAEKEIADELENYEQIIEKGKYPEDFPENINLADESFYYALLASDLLSGKYLELQQKSTNLLRLNSEAESKINLSAIYLLQSKLKEINRPRKLAAANTPTKPMLNLYEYDLKNSYLKQLNLPASLEIDNQEHELIIKGLEAYSGRSWLLFADLNGSVISELEFADDPSRVFVNWTETFFFNLDKKLKDNLYLNSSSSQDDIISPAGYIDVSFAENTELPSSAIFYLAIINQE